MDAARLTEQEISELDQMIIAGEDHDGFIDGRDVVRLAWMVRRLLGPAVGGESVDDYRERVRETQSIAASPAELPESSKATAEDGIPEITAADDDDSVTKSDDDPDDSPSIPELAADAEDPEDAVGVDPRHGEEDADEGDQRGIPELATASVAASAPSSDTNSSPKRPKNRNRGKGRR